MTTGSASAGMPIIVVDHDPAWARVYEQEVRVLRQALGAQLLACHHIGSTSVPRLPAKPILDIILVVADIAALDAGDQCLVELGYDALGENGLPTRRFLSRYAPDGTGIHLHAYADGNPEIARHLAHRDYLRTHPAEAQAYGTLKRELAQEFRDDRDAYRLGKHDLIQTQEKRALEWQALQNK